MDFFTVPTITFGVLCCFFVISHDRRRILHFNVTNHPTSLWTVQQLREAFPFESAPRFLIFDHDAKYGLEVPAVVRSMRISPVRTSFESPWQNALAYVQAGQCQLISRKGYVYKRFGESTEQIAASLNVQSRVLDGEIVCLDTSGKASGPCRGGSRRS
jgi:hypothetical protein